MILKSSLLAVLAHSGCIFAAVYNWDVTWVNRNPDGLKERPVIGINNQWPPPAINANVGEKITVHLTNQLGNETTGLHFHGLFQNGSNSMDGPTGVTQCPIGPGEKFTQVFTVRNIFTGQDLRNSELMSRPGKPAWYLLVSFSQQGSIP